MARQKTTIYLEPDLLRATKILAAGSGRREYEVIEDALRAYMRSEEAAAGRRELRAMLDRWAQAGEGLDEDEALEVATREARAARRRRSSRR
jgi:predicted transcriptional regulator